jgi:hypothetical protein
LIKNRLLTKFISISLTACLCIGVAGCSFGKKDQVQAEPFDGKEYLEISSMTQQGEDPQEAAAEYEPIKNFDKVLSVPTYVTKVDDTYFIVDCYHNRIIYSKEWGLPLDQWYIMSMEFTQPHTLCSDGKVYISDDTENNRIQIFEKIDDKFINTQTFYFVGTRPHYSIYDKATDTFYVWSSMTGELYCFRHTQDSGRIYLTEIKKIPQLDGIYVRSFSIIDGDVYFVSGVSDDNAPAKIYRCSLDTLEIKQIYDVPDELAGMVQITKIGKKYYITTSTDLSGNQDYATIITTDSLEDLASSNYEDIYSKYFIGSGTPYYISEIDGTYYLTEHRLQGHSIWSFHVDKSGNITDVTAEY